MTGWECPRCGRCYAPYIGNCGSCGPRTVHATGTAATGGQPLYFNRFTQTASKVLDAALREALAHGHNYIAPEHIVGAVRRVDPDALASGEKRQ